MKIVGLCGQSGSGKGLICSLFYEFNIVSIDTDKVYHDIISVDSECTKELISVFGDSISLSPGINRKELAKIAFSSKENLEILNSITHKHILNEVRCEIDRIRSEQRFDGIIIDAPLLFESGFDRECDLTLAIIADQETKLTRIVNRDGITREHALARLSSQISDAELVRRCDYVIENNSDVNAIRNRVSELKKIIFD